MSHFRMDKATETQIPCALSLLRIQLQTLSIWNCPIQLVKTVCCDEITAMEVIEMPIMLLGSIMGSQEWVVSLPDQAFIGSQVCATQMSVKS